MSLGIASRNECLNLPRVPSPFVRACIMAEEKVDKAQEGDPAILGRGRAGRVPTHYWQSVKERGLGSSGRRDGAAVPGGVALLTLLALAPMTTS